MNNNDRDCNRQLAVPRFVDGRGGGSRKDDRRRWQNNSNDRQPDDGRRRWDGNDTKNITRDDSRGGGRWAGSSAYYRDDRYAHHHRTWQQRNNHRDEERRDDVDDVDDRLLCDEFRRIRLEEPGRNTTPAESIMKENNNNWRNQLGKLNNSIRPGGFFSHSIDLITGLDSIEHATALRDACCTNRSMLRTVLDSFGFHGSLLVGEDPNINRVRSWYKVNVKTLHVATNDGKKYTIIIEYSTEGNQKLDTWKFKKLSTVFAKHKSPGFLEWLGGATGWRFDDSTTIATDVGGGGGSASWKRCAVIKINTLQDVFKLFAKDAQKFMFDNSKKLVWRKQNELTDAVNDVRVWIETITPKCELTCKLLRNSSTGPDCLVHWAHHHPKCTLPSDCCYGIKLVTESSMLELVKGLIKLFQKEFHHSKSDPLGTRWLNHEKRRTTDFEEAGRLCPEWTTEYLERCLNGNHSRT